MKYEKIEMDRRDVYRKSVPTTLFVFLMGVAVGIVLSMIIVSVVL